MLSVIPSPLIVLQIALVPAFPSAQLWGQTPRGCKKLPGRVQVLGGSQSGGEALRTELLSLSVWQRRGEPPCFAARALFQPSTLLCVTGSPAAAAGRQEPPALAVLFSSFSLEEPYLFAPSLEGRVKTLLLLRFFGSSC